MAAESSPQAEDPSDYNQRRRLRELADAQRTAREALMMADTGEGSPERAHAAVKAYVQQIRWLLVKHGDEQFFNRKLGEWYVSPPDSLTQLARGGESGAQRVNGVDVEAVHGDVSPKVYPILGLVPRPDHGHEYWTFVEAPSSLEGNWTANVEVRHEGPHERTFSRDSPAPLPVEISHSAFSLCNSFLAETGLDIRIEENRPQNHMSWELDQ